MKNKLMQLAEEAGWIQTEAQEAGEAFKRICERIAGPIFQRTQCLGCDYSKEDAHKVVQQFDRLLQLIGVKPEELNLGFLFGDRTWAEVRGKILNNYRQTCLSAPSLVNALRSHLST